MTRLNTFRLDGKTALITGDTLWDHGIELNQTVPFILSRELGKELVARARVKKKPVVYRCSQASDDMLGTLRVVNGGSLGR